MDRWIGFSALLERELERLKRLMKDAIMPPLVSSILFISIFGIFIGGRFGDLNGVPYIEFIVPGLIMLNVIQSSFTNTSFSLYLQRFQRSMEDVLISPMSYFSMVLAFTLGGVARGFIIGIAIYLIGMLFIGRFLMFDFLAFVFLLFTVSLLFASLGLIVGLWAEEFEHLGLLPTFIIGPLTFLGGVFHSTQLLPPLMQQLTYLNPFFYFVDAFRYSVTGVVEGNLLLSFTMTIVFTIASVYTATYLFRKGYKLRT